MILAQIRTSCADGAAMAETQTGRLISKLSLRTLRACADHQVIVVELSCA